MRKRILLALSLSLVLGLNLYFRSFPIYFPQLKSQAKAAVDQTIKRMAMQDAYKKFPQFYSLAKDQIVKSWVAEYKKHNKKEIKKQIQETYNQMKDRFQDEQGQTYLMELDCWHWARYVDNVLKLGHPGDETVYGKQWDLFMLAPLGSFLPSDQFLFHFSAFLYKVFTFFKPVPLFNFLFYLPLFFIALFITALFGFSFRYGKYMGAIITCLFVGLAPTFLPRSCAGWFDMDILNLLFPVLILWTYLLSVDGKFPRSRLAWISVSAFLVGLFCFTWTHWWFIPTFILIYQALLLGYLVFRNQALLKQHGIFLFLFVVFSIIWIMVLVGIEPLNILYNQVKEALTLNKPLSPTVWPSVYSTVSELRKFELKDSIRSIGGGWLAAASAISMLVLFLRALFSRRYPDFKRAAIFILAIWFVSMYYASSRGVRFVVFLLVPLGIFLGWGMNELYEHFRDRRNIKGVVAVILIFLALSGITINKGYRTARSIFPLMDDTWYKILNLIKEKTPPDTIVNSWWDFGDWFKVVGRRRVIFDGQSSYRPQVYWMAKAMLTSDENESVNILRMLNNAGNRAFEIIDAQLNDQLKSVLLLEYVLKLSPEKGKEVLNKFLPESVAEEVFKIIFYPAGRAVFLTDNTMPFKMGAISYLGNWSFPRVYIAKNFNSKEKAQIIDYLKGLGRDENEMQRFYQEVFLISTKKLDEWLSHRLLYYSGISNSKKEGDAVIFDNGIVYYPKTKTIESSSGQMPVSLFIAQDNNLEEKILPNPNTQVSLLIFENEKGYKSVLLDRDLGASVFTRLYFLNGRTLRHFVPYIEVEFDNNYIRVFTISW